VSDAADRLDACAQQWGVAVGATWETESSLLAHGHRGRQAVVLKVVKREGDEWRSGEVLSAFDGRGAIHVYEHIPGAMLLERLDPGESLIGYPATGRDDEAVTIIAGVIGAMDPTTVPRWCPTLRDWGHAFDWYAGSGDSQIPDALVTRAALMFDRLAGSQRNTRLLHGDLQHSNILFDRDRGWLAIDPKGVVGEVEYEVAAALRNPRESPEIVGDRTVIERRIDGYCSQLGLDRDRVRDWAFANAVLSMIWSVQDEGRVDANDPSRLLADLLSS
jgi:streptomycin 6-kinase